MITYSFRAAWDQSGSGGWGVEGLEYTVKVR